MTLVTLKEKPLVKDYIKKKLKKIVCERGATYILIIIILILHDIYKIFLEFVVLHLNTYITNNDDDFRW